MFISKRRHEPAHYMLKIESFSLLCKAKTFKIESDIFEAVGHKWRLDLYPNGKEEKKNSHISLYVVLCDTESCSKGWEFSVDVSFFVYDHIRHNYITYQDVNGHSTFHENKRTWGFDKLIPLYSFMHYPYGYLFNDSCVFGVEVNAVPPEFTQVDRCLVMTNPPAKVSMHTWTINNFSALPKDELTSEVFKVGKVKWKLSLFPKGLISSQGTNLSIFLRVHDAASLPDDWKVYAQFKLRVKSQSTKYDLERATDNWFRNSVLDWGFASFMPLSKLNDSKYRFLLNDNLKVEAQISVIGTLKNFI